MYLIYLLLLKVILSKYNRTKALRYVDKHYKTPNHKCGFGRWQCTPYGYFGNSHCKYSRSDDDSSNFVSQVLIESGHPKIIGEKCKGIPCGVEINANNLGYCLRNNFKWKSECKKNLPPPKYIMKGDIAIEACVVLSTPYSTLSNELSIILSSIITMLLIYFVNQITQHPLR